MENFDIDIIKEFLVQAKRATYASQGDEASVTPVLNGSKQLEYESGDFIYRDIYWGMSFFIGQEVIEWSHKPIWSMVYSGGTIGEMEMGDVLETYVSLRKAMRLVNQEEIYRGPKEYVNGDYIYLNEAAGHFDNFWGYETIRKNGMLIYELRYSGGMIK